MRAFDWSTTALGAPQGWPELLKHSISLCLTSKFPISMYWGPDRIMLYNDPYIQFIGEAEHPRYLGRPARQAWNEIWDELDPLFERVERTGEATWSTEFPLFVSRNLPKEEVYVTFTIGPILSAAGTVDGFFCPCTDVTDTVVGARRRETLRKLGVAALAARTIDTACETAATVLAENPRDIPFAGIYVVNDHGANAALKSVRGFLDDEHPFPRAAAVADVTASPWPLAAALRSRRPEDTRNLVEAHVALPGGSWPEPASRAVVVPIFAPDESLSGLVTLGVGPRQVLDGAYRAFFGLIAANIGTALANATAYAAAQQRAESMVDLTRLAESRRLFEQMADASPDTIYIYDCVERRTSYVSARAEQVIGYTADEIIEREHSFAMELWHPDDVTRLPEYRRRLAALADGEIFETEYRVRQRDGGYRWLRSRVAPLSRTANGGLQQLVGVTHDVTDRKRVDEALRESEQRLRSYFQLGLIGMAITAPTKGILEVNDEICRILGYERDELLHKTWAELTHPDDLAADLRQFNQVMAGEIDGYSLDKRWIRKDGGIIDATISVKCVRTADGAVDYFVALLQDITERTRTNQALTRAREDLERRVAARTRQLSVLNEGLLRLHELSTHQLPDADLGQILNDALIAVIAIHGADFGTIKTCRGDPAILEIVAHQGFRQEFLDYFNAVADASLASGRAQQRQQRVIIEDVQTDPGFAPHRAVAAAAGFRAVQSTPIVSRSGRPLGIISTHFRQPHRPSDEALRLTDLFASQVAEVIERKRSEAALLEHQRELQELTSRLIEAQEAASKYVARELHDVFSQQLAMIGREVASLDRRASLSPDALANAIREITRQIHTLAGDLHRMSRHIHPAILADLGLSAAIRSECVAFSEEHQMPVAFQADDLRPGIPEAVALCLYRVAQEALRNVGKHAGVSSVHVHLQLTTAGLALTVDDTGKGFEVATIAGKRGLGLVSMEERLRMVGGTLTVESKPGDGTSVVAAVPLSR